MPSYVTPKKNTEYIFYISLVSQSDTKIMQSNPTIAAGDFKVSTDGGALGNLGTLPVVTPAASKMVKVTLSASEMNGDNVTFEASDAAGSEWCDLTINIQTTATQIDNLVRSTTPGNTLNVDGNNRAEVLLGAVTHTGAVIPTVTTLTGHTVQTGDSFGRIGVAGAGLSNINLPNQTMDITGNITGNLSGSVGSVTGTVGSVTGAVGSVAGNVDGNVTGSVGSLVGHTVQTGDNFARLGGPAGASVSADIVVVKTETADIKAKTDNLPDGIKKNTALNNFEFVMIASSDHVTGKTGETVTAQRSIDGAAFAACANSVSEVSGGVYKINFAASDLNGDVITFLFTAANSDARWITIPTQT